MIVRGDAHITPQHVELFEYGNIVGKYIKNINEVYEDVAVDKYVIMPNHIHMIVVVQKQNNVAMWVGIASYDDTNSKRYTFNENVGDKANRFFIVATIIPRPHTRVEKGQKFDTACAVIAFRRYKIGYK